MGQLKPGVYVTGPDYDYCGLLASTWDVWRDDTARWSDRFFFLDVIGQYGEPVLDIGCGTGRLLLDYLARGIDIDGVDNSGEMLAICRSKARRQHLPAPALYQQRMEQLKLARSYRTILCPSSVMQLITGAGAAAGALRRLRDHLQPGGGLVAAFAFQWRPGDPLDTGWELLFEKPGPAGGAIVRAWNREWRDPASQVWHTEQRFEIEADGKVVETQHYRRSPEGRWYTQVQAAELFRASGYRNIRLLHEFTSEPARQDDRLYCVLAEQPATGKALS